jgi:hypothetical protein
MFSRLFRLEAAMLLIFAIMVVALLKFGLQ